MGRRVALLPELLPLLLRGSHVTLITIRLGAQLAPDMAGAVRAGLVDKLWEHGVPVQDIVIGTDWEGWV